MRTKYLSLEHGIFYATPFARSYEIVCRNDDWAIVRRVNTCEIRLIHISRFGQMYAHTGAKFPRSPLAVNCREVDPGVFEAAAEISDFLFIKCRAGSTEHAVRSVINYVAENITGGKKPVYTTYSLFGASARKFPGFKITGEPIYIEPEA